MVVIYINSYYQYIFLCKENVFSILPQNILRGQHAIKSILYSLQFTATMIVPLGTHSYTGIISKYFFKGEIIIFFDNIVYIITAVFVLN